METNVNYKISWSIYIIISLRKLKAAINLVAMNDRFFLVKLAAIEDYDSAKYRKAWMIFNHYLIVEPWKPNFDPE